MIHVKRGLTPAKHGKLCQGLTRDDKSRDPKNLLFGTLAVAPAFVCLNRLLQSTTRTVSLFISIFPKWTQAGFGFGDGPRISRTRQEVWLGCWVCVVDLITCKAQAS